MNREVQTGDVGARRQAFSDAPVGAGPFRVLEIKPNEQILVERFDEYYYHPDNGLDENRRARFQTLDLRLVPEPAIRVAALRAGEADIGEVNLAVAKAGGGWGRQNCLHQGGRLHFQHRDGLLEAGTSLLPQGRCAMRSTTP